MLTDEVSQRWWNQEDGAAQWTSMTEQIGVFRSRYQRYENGWLVEQVGFYANGQLDHHFHMGRDGRNVGSQRMWYPNGQPYIDQFHDEDGLLHGPQWRWRSDGVLDRGDQFNHGVAVDAAGRPLPGDGKTIFFRQTGGC